MNSSGGRVENAASVPVSGQAAEVQVRAEQPVIRAAARTGDPLHDVAGEIDDVDARLVVPELGQEEGAPMARSVRRDEERVGGEGAPRAGDGAEAAEVSRREAQQDVEQHVRGDPVGARGGARPHGPGRRRSHHGSLRGHGHDLTEQGYASMSKESEMDELERWRGACLL